ncbi:MAG: DUF3536 domain-containing protein [Candidatus Gastranaerophilales bacterium]|nr:DUF3536 domain-containing protein [Candidatus Gastranaerophilales bacterium]
MAPYKKYLTIHGHFYQPPRENPWLECIELQETANPCHDWNVRVCKECYSPNSISKIVGGDNKVLDIVNNYSYMSFNMGPTLLSWMEKNAPYTYSRVIKADEDSAKEFGGHGNALAQVYNHIIMPLANDRDKLTQVLWGIADFKCRFNRMPEGIWLAETACDDETLGVLADCGIKFTVLSPYQAEKVKYGSNAEFTDVSNGQINTTKPYIYNIKSRPGKSINLFFYNAQISQAVAFEELLKDGGRFVEKIKTGISKDQSSDELVNIATDGESYGHHTKFGDMALSYVLRIKSCDEGFTLTNYGQYLELHPAVDEVVIKPVSSWSCCHGVGRWKENCGCSTGGMQGWNQKWRKPLREALDNLRDELAKITEKEGKKYFKDVWQARNEYIQVILDRNEFSIKTFFDKTLLDGVSEQNKVKALKIMEMQRQALLMYTSCGWFFNEISGIETIQIMKYAARAIQLAAEFSHKDLEKDFLEILSEAKSNIPEYGSGRDIWNKFVKPNVINIKQIVSLWAIKYIYNNTEADSDLYCFSVHCQNVKKTSKGKANLLTGHIEITSKITTEKFDLMFVLMQHSDGDFHCAVKEFAGGEQYLNIMKNIIYTFRDYPRTETIRLIDEYFGREYYTLKDIFAEDRRNILKELLKAKTDRFQNIYREIYNEGRGSVLNFKYMGLEVPPVYKLAAQYTLSQDFNDIFKINDCLYKPELIQQACEINDEAKLLDISLDKSGGRKIISDALYMLTRDFAKNLDYKKLAEIFSVLTYADCLDIEPDINIPQNIYFTKIYQNFSKIITKIMAEEKTILDAKDKLMDIVKLGDKLHIDTQFYKNVILNALSKVSV